jgi:hypothetical protein
MVTKECQFVLRIHAFFKIKASFVEGGLLKFCRRAHIVALLSSEAIKVLLM